MIALIIANIALVVLDGLDIVASLIGVYKNKRPIIIKEAKALRGYYEEKLKYAENMAEKAERDCKEYKRLYESELETRREANGIERRNGELILQVSKLEGELSSCEDRIEAMAKENDELKKKIKELSKPAKKGEK